MTPVAIGWTDPTSPSHEWDRAVVQRLARRLGYSLRWSDPASVLGLVEQVEASGVDVVLLPSAAHVDAVTLNRLLGSVEVECAAPRESFARWSPLLGYVR